METCPFCPQMPSQPQPPSIFAKEVKLSPRAGAGSRAVSLCSPASASRICMWAPHVSGAERKEPFILGLMTRIRMGLIARDKRLSMVREACVYAHVIV